jgi:hypothetical protein
MYTHRNATALTNEYSAVVTILVGLTITTLNNVLATVNAIIMIYNAV